MTCNPCVWCVCVCVYDGERQRERCSNRQERQVEGAEMGRERSREGQSEVHRFTGQVAAVIRPEAN